jgi:hypothetical protein
LYGAFPVKRCFSVYCQFFVRRCVQGLEEAETAHQQALVRRDSASPKAFWQAVRSTFVRQFNDTAKGEAEAKVLDEASKSLGLPTLEQAGGELCAALKEAETQAGRARMIGRGLLQAVGAKWWWLGAAVLLVLVPVGVTALIKLLGEALSLAWFKEIGSATIGLSSTLAVVASYLGWATRRVSGALDKLESFRDQLDSAIRDAQPPADFAEAERQVAVSQAAVAQAEQQYAKAEQREREARQELEGGTARGRLNRFIRDKVVAGDYAKHLGIVATIRRDFDQLARIMDDANNERERAEGQRLEKEHRQRVKAFIRQHRKYLERKEIRELLRKTAEVKLRLFRRMILYIDDLDRCPPTKVVEVLQAIHLLLYFNLFVVVVAVDARWVSRALIDRYRGLLDDEAKPSRRRSAAATSAYDYLEKIFQIPYWVRPMEGAASEVFVGSLVGAGVVVEAPLPSSADLPQPESDQPPRVDLPPDTPPGAEILPRRPPTAAAQARGDAAPVDPRPETLTLSRSETELMRRLAPYLGQSPRRAKRFVNVYRLVKAGLPQSRIDALVGRGGASPGYRALLTQLAIVTGAPRTASLYFAAFTGRRRPRRNTRGVRCAVGAGSDSRRLGQLGCHPGRPGDAAGVQRGAARGRRHGDG